MQTTSISWCDYTWSPVTGCSHFGPECTNCWAERLSRRQAEKEHPPAFATDHPWTQEHAEENVTMHVDRLDAPDHYGYPEGPGRVFVVSMGDLFHREVDPGFAQRVLDRARAHPECVWICLTKRPHNAADWRLDWPPNAMLGVSVGSGPGGEYPNTTHRIEQLRDVNVARKWVSFEPLIEPIGEVALDHIDWAVVGGETGPDGVRRDLEHEWACELLRQCEEQDVAYHFKQSSARYPETGTRLTVYNEEFGVYEQRRIREFPELPEVTRTAREQSANHESPQQA